MASPEDILALNRAFGLVIRQRRTAMRMSQEKFAFESEYDRTYLSGIERGVRNPTLATIARLAAALGTEPSSLLRSAEALAKKEKAG